MIQFYKVHYFMNTAAKSLQLCPTLCDPVDGSPPGSPVPGILQARTLEWVAISFSSAWKWKMKVKSPSRVRLLATPWTAAYQAPPSMGFSGQEYWRGCHCLLHFMNSSLQSVKPQKQTFYLNSDFSSSQAQKILNCKIEMFLVWLFLLWAHL